MKVLDLFSGIGGFALGLEAAGFETVAFCEIDSYAQKVLKKNWPGVPIYDDVRRITADRLVSDGIGVDVITGGFPCQDISVAGHRAGITAERSGLWSECARLLGEIRPRYAIFENVTNLLNGGGGDWFKRVLWDISSVGYDAEWHCIPASAIGAHHHRDRIWIVAYPQGIRLQVSNQQHGLSPEEGRQGAILSGCDFGKQYFADEPNVGRVAHGIPSRAHRLRCLGNAVVPQIPELIGRQIMEAERGRA
jgi:DNA (cytosine-5)-methyltransferase 1